MMGYLHVFVASDIKVVVPTNRIGSAHVFSCWLTICDAGPASNQHGISAPCLCHDLPVGKVRLPLRRLNPLCVDDSYIIFNILLIFK